MGTDSVILGGDLNAWSTWWGSRTNNGRGIDLVAALDEMEMHILNEGIEPTFYEYRGDRRYTSSVDVTTCTTNLLGKIRNWRLSVDLITSDHRAILFELCLGKAVGTDIRRTTRIYNTRKANWGRFREKFTLGWRNTNMIQTGKIATKEYLETKIKEYTTTILDACDNSMPRLSTKRSIKFPWWTEKLTELKRETDRKRRHIANAAPIRREWVVDQYRAAKAQYHKEMKAAQTSSWKDMTSSALSSRERPCGRVFTE